MNYYFFLFTGSELVDWVMSNLSIEDRGKRLSSLLTKLCCTSIPVGMGHNLWDFSKKNKMFPGAKCVRHYTLFKNCLSSYFLAGYKLSIIIVHLVSFASS